MVALLAALRASHLPALLAVLSLALGVAAPAVACGLGMALPMADAGATEAPCSMPDHDPAPPAPPADDCCVVTSPAVPIAGSSVLVPPAPVMTPAVSPALRTPSPVAVTPTEAAGPPPRPPEPLHLLHGRFLT